ncbi:CDP-glucose 4,6-dehydratase [Desulfonatronospira thiodismutans ASO3-1]|uniref:CDP-glucose 4,6-dehydratase n=1 Tax=Desulfonatronospira thiodismutans ASO3-1 TaxID=555779 RepID=D6SKT6_9BACT|nr:CDP-glucose 4,6-dehydratase [Desulfonatronospira thiodismutans]EFI35297.1 CDP-glucose 4,6-dehydratase [Desulfonatronospira thiodismutans ASO3-1]
MNTKFWDSKRVLITGNTGFKGSWLTLLLQSLGAEVIGFSLPPPTEPSLFELSRADHGIVMVYGDIRNRSVVQETMDRYRPQIVMHLAAQSLVRASYENPVETYDINLMGTVHILDAMRNTPGIKAAVMVTSDKCYENQEQDRPYREEDPMGGYDPYSSSKGCDELIISAYRRSYFSNNNTALASVRAGNVVGGGDWAKDRLVVDAMQAFMHGKPLVLRNPDAVRPWQHVLDPLYGYLMLAEKMWEHGASYASAWNFGPGRESSQSVSQLANMLCRFWGNGACWVSDKVPSDQHEANLLLLDARKAEMNLDWYPQMDAATSLAWTVEWYRAYSKGADMREFTLQQLSDFAALSRFYPNHEPPKNKKYGFYPDHP